MVAVVGYGMRNATGLQSFEGSWSLLLNNSRELVPIAVLSANEYTPK